MQARQVKYQIHATGRDGVIYSIGERGMLTIGSEPIENKQLWNEYTLQSIRLGFDIVVSSTPDVREVVTRIVLDPPIGNGVPADQTWIVHGQKGVREHFDAHMYRVDPDTWQSLQDMLDGTVKMPVVRLRASERQS